MGYVPGADVVLVVDGVDVSPMCSAVEVTRSIDDVEVATFGAQAHGYAATLLDGDVMARGVYDDTAGSGTRDVIGAALGQVVTLGYLPDDPGATGQTCRALVVSYDESGALFEMVAWEAEFQISGDVTADALYTDVYQPTY